MKKTIFWNPLHTGMQVILLLAISIFSVGTGSTNVAHAKSSLNTAAGNNTACGQLLTDAEAAFVATLAPDGSVPATPETQAAAQEYIRVAKLCYEQIEAENAPKALQGETPTFIDEGGLVPGHAAFAEYVTWGTKWGSSTPGTSGGTVTFSFMGDEISFGAEGYGTSTAISRLPNPQACFITDIKQAFAAWQAVSNIKFVQATDSGVAFDTPGATGDIRIGAHSFDGSSGILAHAYFPPPAGYTYSDAGDMHFDTAENWSCNPGANQIDIGIVALHEIGHSLGLDHEATAAVTVMDPTYNANLTSLQPDDRSGIAAIYGPAQMSAPPDNDDFLAAKLISGLTYFDALDTTGATQDVTDPDNIGPCDDNEYLNKGKNSVWYKYKPSVNESISVDTAGSTDPIGDELDTIVAVWTGTEGNLSLVKCDDDKVVGLTSQLSFVGIANTTYYFEAATYDGLETGGGVGSQNGGNLVFNVNIGNLDVYIGNSLQESYYIYNTDTIIDYYPSVVNGPVKVVSATGQDIFASQRAIYGSSFNELMGYPADQFSTEYWFPWYDGIYMTTWILVGNPNPSKTAYVNIYIGGVKQNSTPYAIPPGGNVTPTFPGVLDGPVRVVSVTGAGTTTPIALFASERSTYLSSFNEVMGFPANKFTTEYWFPWYDQIYMNTWVLVGNPSGSQNAYVDIYIGGVKQGSTFTIPPNGNITPQFPGVVDGPVRVVSVSGAGTPTPINIFASERSTYQGSFNEVMGVPKNEFTTDYWYTWYDNSSMTTWILVGNPSDTEKAYVEIYIGGVKQGQTYTIPENGRITPQFDVDSGPVQILSVAGPGTPTAIPVFTSERVIYSTSFNEMMGYPANQLTSEYWFTWYDSIYMNTDLVVAKP